jgi:hypothetical protein
VGRLAIAARCTAVSPESHRAPRLQCMSRAIISDQHHRSAAPRPIVGGQELVVDEVADHLKRPPPSSAGVRKFPIEHEHENRAGGVRARSRQGNAAKGGEGRATKISARLLELWIRRDSEAKQGGDTKGR